MACDQTEHRLPNALQAFKQTEVQNHALRGVGVCGGRGEDLHPLLDDAESHAGGGRTHTGRRKGRGNIQ